MDDYTMMMMMIISASDIHNQDSEFIYSFNRIYNNVVQRKTEIKSSHIK